MLPTLNCRREISVCSPAQEVRQHSGEVRATSNTPWSPTQTKSSLVVCTPLAICPAAWGCQNSRQLCPFHTTFQRCQEAFWLQNILFPGTPVFLHHHRSLWTLEVPASAQLQPVGHICSHFLKEFLEVGTSLNCCSPSGMQTPTEHVLNLSQVEVWNVTESLLRESGTKPCSTHDTRSGGAVPCESDFPSLKVLHTVLLFAWGTAR